MEVDDAVSAYGVIVNVDGYPLDELVAHIRRIEALGYESVWITDLFGRDVFVTAGYLLSRTERITVGSGIVPIYGRDATAAAQAARTLDEMHPGRFILGLGLSHPMLAEARGHTWQEPVATATAYVGDARRAALLRPPLAGREVPVYLAAHGPKMVAGPARVADGVLTYMQTPRSCGEIRETVGPDAVVDLMLPCCLTTDAEIGRRMGRNALRIYLSLPAYQRLWRREGFAPQDWADGGSDALVDTYVNWGDLAAITTRVRRYLDAGVSNVIVSAAPSRRGDPASVWPLLEALAPGSSPATVGGAAAARAVTSSSSAPSGAPDRRGRRGRDA
jgi:probable F420-dependent oxidoreductase